MAVGVLLSAVVVPGLLPADEGEIWDAVVSGAQDAGAAAQSARLVAQAQLDGRVIGTYRSAVLDDARQRASEAARVVLDCEVVGAEGVRLRDRAVPLLTEAVGAITDAARAAEDGDRGGLADTVGRLVRVSRGLGEVGAEAA